MGYAPDWTRANHGKKPAASVAKPQTKFGIVSKPLFHNAVQKFADGGEVELNVNGDKVGDYSGSDDIVKYRMNQTDAEGNNLRIPESAKTTQSQMEVQDMENGSGSSASSAKSEAVSTSSPAAAPARMDAKKPARSSVPKTVKTTPQSQYDYNDMENGPGETTSANPEMVRKAYIDAANIQRKQKT